MPANFAYISNLLHVLQRFLNLVGFHAPFADRIPALPSQVRAAGLAKLNLGADQRISPEAGLNAAEACLAELIERQTLIDDIGKLKAELRGAAPIAELVKSLQAVLVLEDSAAYDGDDWNQLMDSILVPLEEVQRHGQLTQPAFDQLNGIAEDLANTIRPIRSLGIVIENLKDSDLHSRVRRSPQAAIELADQTEKLSTVLSGEATDRLGKLAEQVLRLADFVSYQDLQRVLKRIGDLNPAKHKSLAPLIQSLEKILKDRDGSRIILPPAFADEASKEIDAWLLQANSPSEIETLTQGKLLLETWLNQHKDPPNIEAIVAELRNVAMEKFQREFCKITVDLEQFVGRLRRSLEQFIDYQMARLEESAHSLGPTCVISMNGALKDIAIARSSYLERPIEQLSNLADPDHPDSRFLKGLFADCTFGPIAGRTLENAITELKHCQLGRIAELVCQRKVRYEDDEDVKSLATFLPALAEFQRRVEFWEAVLRRFLDHVRSSDAVAEDSTDRDDELEEFKRWVARHSFDATPPSLDTASSWDLLVWLIQLPTAQRRLVLNTITCGPADDEVEDWLENRSPEKTTHFRSSAGVSVGLQKRAWLTFVQAVNSKRSFAWVRELVDSNWQVGAQLGRLRLDSDLLAGMAKRVAEIQAKAISTGISLDVNQCLTQLWDYLTNDRGLQQQVVASLPIAKRQFRISVKVDDPAPESEYYTFRWIAAGREQTTISDVPVTESVGVAQQRANEFGEAINVAFVPLGEEPEADSDDVPEDVLDLLRRRLQRIQRLLPYFFTAPLRHAGWRENLTQELADLVGGIDKILSDGDQDGVSAIDDGGARGRRARRTAFEQRLFAKFTEKLLDSFSATAIRLHEDQFDWPSEKHFEIDRIYEYHKLLTELFTEATRWMARKEDYDSAVKHQLDTTGELRARLAAEGKKIQRKRTRVYEAYMELMTEVSDQVIVRDELRRPSLAVLDFVLGFVRSDRCRGLVLLIAMWLLDDRPERIVEGLSWYSVDPKDVGGSE